MNDYTMNGKRKAIMNKERDEEFKQMDKDQSWLINNHNYPLDDRKKFC